MESRSHKNDPGYAVEDIFNRTLNGISDDFGRLICIASTRDYNTGRYHHDGLESSFSKETAEAALAECHTRVFSELTLRTVRGIVEELERYIASTGADPIDVIDTWRRLEPYRVAIPRECESLAAELFFSNIRIALTILATRQPRSQRDPQFS